MPDLCRWLHIELEQLPLVRYPFDREELPKNGIYFFYEVSESWGHGGYRPRIVRVGTHKEDNFRSRIAEHFLLDPNKMNFDHTKSAPHDRSIFRKNIGRALLARDGDAYLKVWDIDFMTRATRKQFGHLRDIEKERRVEAEVTRLLRRSFSFRYVALEGQVRRMGSMGLEAVLIGTLAHCDECGPSRRWLGSYSPVERIRRSGLWLFQHLGAAVMTKAHQQLLAEAIDATVRDS